MSSDTPGRVALVTGGSRGIGAAIAADLYAQGYRVAATSRSATAPEGVLPIACDVTDVDSVDAAFSQVEQEFGPVEVLIANAGITRDGLLARMKEEDFTEVLDTNLTGAYRVIHRAARAGPFWPYRLDVISGGSTRFPRAGQLCGVEGRNAWDGPLYNP